MELRCEYDRFFEVITSKSIEGTNYLGLEMHISMLLVVVLQANEVNDLKKEQYEL